MSDKLKVSVLGNPTPNNYFLELYKKVVDTREQSRSMECAPSEEHPLINTNEQYGSIYRVQQCQRTILKDPLIVYLKNMLLEIELTKTTVSFILSGDGSITPDDATILGDNLRKRILTDISDREKQIMNHFGLEVPNHEPDKTQKAAQGE